MLKAIDILRKEFPKADSDDRVVRAVSQMKSQVDSDVMIFKGGELAGVFSPGFAMRTRINITETKLDGLKQPIRPMDKDDDLGSLEMAMLSQGIDVIPIKKGKDIIGTVHILDTLEKAKREVVGVSLKRIKTIDRPAIDSSESISKAIEMLRSNNALVVNDDDLPVGIICPYDIIRNIHLFSQQRDFGGRPGSSSKAFKAEKKDPYSLPVTDFIAYKQDISVSSSIKADDAIQSMIRNDVLHLLIEDTGRIISARDILRHIHRKPLSSDIEIVGMKQLEIDRILEKQVESMVERASASFSDKMKKPIMLKIHIKSYKSQDKEKKHKYSIKAHIISAGETISVDKAYGWDLAVAIKDALKDLEHRVDGRFRKRSFGDEKPAEGISL